MSSRSVVCGNFSWGIALRDILTIEIVEYAHNGRKYLCNNFSQTLHNLVDLTFTIRLQQRRKGEPALEPNERRRTIIEIISHRRYDTMRNLACEFGVSWQTIYRDMQVLAEEYPLIMTRGNGGGVELPKGYYVSQKYLTLKQEAAIRRNLDMVSPEDRSIFESILSDFACKKDLDNTNT